MELEIFNIVIKINILDNFSKEKNMEKEIIFLVKALYLQDFGKMTIKFKGNSFYLMVMYSTVVLKIIKDIKEPINIEMEIFMRELGKMMLKKDLENYFYKMAKVIKVALPKDKNMEKEFILGKMEIDMLEIFNMINGKDLDNIYGRMVEFIKVNGAQIAWMDMVG